MKRGRRKQSFGKKREISSDTESEVLTLPLFIPTRREIGRVNTSTPEEEIRRQEEEVLFGIGSNKKRSNLKNRKRRFSSLKHGEGKNPLEVIDIGRRPSTNSPPKKEKKKQVKLHVITLPRNNVNRKILKVSPVFSPLSVEEQEMLNRSNSRPRLSGNTPLGFGRFEGGGIKFLFRNINLQIQREMSLSYNNFYDQKKENEETNTHPMLLGDVTTNKNFQRTFIRIPTPSKNRKFTQNDEERRGSVIKRDDSRLSMSKKLNDFVFPSPIITPCDDGLSKYKMDEFFTSDDLYDVDYIVEKEAGGEDELKVCVDIQKNQLLQKKVEFRRHALHIRKQMEIFNFRSRIMRIKIDEKGNFTSELRKRYSQVKVNVYKYKKHFKYFFVRTEKKKKKMEEVTGKMEVLRKEINKIKLQLTQKCKNKENMDFDVFDTLKMANGIAEENRRLEDTKRKLSMNSKIYELSSLEIAGSKHTTENAMPLILDSAGLKALKKDQVKLKDAVAQVKTDFICFFDKFIESFESVSNRIMEKVKTECEDRYNDDQHSYIKRYDLPHVHQSIVLRKLEGSVEFKMGNSIFSSYRGGFCSMEMGHNCVLIFRKRNKQEILEMLSLEGTKFATEDDQKTIRYFASCSLPCGRLLTVRFGKRKKRDEWIMFARNSSFCC